MNYEVIAFNSITDNPIYHTNVIMNLGEVTALVCFEAIKERELSERIRSQFEESERTVIDISIDQILHPDQPPAQHSRVHHNCS